MRFTITKTIYWFLGLIMCYITFGFKNDINKLDELMRKYKSTRFRKIIKILICILTGFSIAFKSTVLANYLFTVDKNIKGILFQSEFLQTELFGDKINIQPIIKDSSIKMSYFIIEISLENILFFFTLLSMLLIDPENHNNNKNNYNPNEVQNVDQENNPPIDHEIKIELDNENENLNSFVLTPTNLKNQIKIYLDEKFGLFFMQFVTLIILSFLNISLLNLPIFLSLIFMMFFSICIPNTYNCLNIINKIYGVLSFMILSANFIKNTNTLINTKQDYLIGITNFEANYSYLYFGFLFFSYIISSFLNRYDLSDREFQQILDESENQLIFEDVRKNEDIQEEIKEKQENFVENNFDNNKINEKPERKNSEKIDSPKEIIGESENSTILSSLKKFFFLISPLLYKVILLIWILFYVCLIMFINFVILFFAIEKAKKYFKQNYLIPSFIVCILFTTIQFCFNMNGLFFYENVKIYKILEIIGVYKIYKQDITNFSDVRFIDASNESKIFGMLFNIASISLLYCSGLAMNVYNEEETISTEKKQENKNVDKDLIEISQIISETDNEKYKLLKNEKKIEEEINLISTDKIKNIKIPDSPIKLDKNLDNKNIIFKNVSEIGNVMQKETDKDPKSPQNLYSKDYYSKMKLNLIHFWIEKSYLSCLIVTFVCSVIKFDLLHIIYFIYFIILLCLGDKGFKPVWDNLMLINRIIIIIVLYFWNILAVNFLDLEKETNPQVENIFTYLGLKINKNSIFFVEYWEHIFLYLFGYLHNYFVVYWYIYIVHNDNRTNINISLDTSLNNSYLENEKIASVKHIYRFPEWTRKITICLVIFLMVLLAFIKPLSFQGLVIFALSLIFLTVNLFVISENKKGIIRGLIKALIIISIISIVLKYCINFSFLVNCLKNFFNLEDSSTMQDKTNNFIQTRLNTVTGEDPSLSFNLGDYSNSEMDNPNLKSFSLQDFGLDFENFKLKLFINFLMILIMKILFSYSYYNDEQEKKEEEIINPQYKRNKNEDEEGPTIINHLYNLIKYSENDFVIKTQEILTFIKILIFQIIYLHSCKIMFLAAVFVCVSIESMIGVIIFGVILISLFMEYKSGWKYSFFPLVFLSVIIMSFIYICKMNAFKKWMTKDYEWFGLYYPKSYYSIFSQEFPYIVILFTSYLSRISAIFKDYFNAECENEKIYENYFNNNLEKKELNNNSENPKEENKVIQVEEKEKEIIKSEEIDIIKVEDSKNKNISGKLIQKDFEAENQNLEKDFSNLFQEKVENDKNDESLLKMNFENDPKTYLSETELTGVLILSKFWIRIEFFWYLYGFYVVLITIMLIAFIKVNLLSLIFMTFVGMQSFGVYIRTEFRTDKEDENKSNLKMIKRNWMIFSAFLAIFTFLQYINYMWFPPSWKIQKPWERVSFFCAQEGKSIYSYNVNFKNISDFDYCVADWKAWLNIDNYSTQDIFFNFICLFLLLNTNKYFNGDELANKQREQFVEKKSMNFTIAENRKTIWDTFSFVLFIYLKSFILLCIIIMSIVYSYKYTNLIYGGFMFISFYLLFKEAALTKQKNNLWKYVQYYNFLVLVGFMLFQTPFLPCPVNRDGRSYIGLEECVFEENKLYKTFLLFEYPKTKIDALYMMMVQTIGVLKLDFKLLIVGNLSLFLIYIVALIQQIIFDHPYQVYVDKYLDVEKNINCKSRAFKIVQDSHLQMKCDYRKIHTNMEILNDKLQRLNRRTSEYSRLWNQTNLRSSFEAGHAQKNHLEKAVEAEQLENIKKEIKFSEDLDILIENLLTEKDLAGDIDYTEIKKKAKEIRVKMEEKKTQEEIQKEKEKKDYIKIKEEEELKQKEIMKIEQEEKKKEEYEELSPLLIESIKPEIKDGENKMVCCYPEEEQLEKNEIVIILSEEEKFKNELIEILITELGKLIATQENKDKLELYKTEDHGLEIALPVYEKMIRDKNLEDLFKKEENELIMLKILFPHPDDPNKNILAEQEFLQSENNFPQRISFKKYSLDEKKLGSNINILGALEKNKTIIENENNISSGSQNQPVKAKTEIIKYIQIELNKNESLSKLNIESKLSSEKKNLWEYIYKKFVKAIDKILLLDMSSTKILQPNNFFEVFLFWIYSKIEIFIIIVFVINTCVDASVISMIYPISYFCYGLLEYPFTNKYYWKSLTVYSLVTITLKLIYQFPFFCGFPFLSVFNIFIDNYCETYNLSETDFLDNFDYFLGLRKYNGEYSYPKNSGLLSGILWDIIILCLLLINRSLLKSKGIWNFVDNQKDFTKVPVFIHEKPNKNIEKENITTEQNVNPESNEGEIKEEKKEILNESSKNKNIIQENLENIPKVNKNNEYSEFIKERSDRFIYFLKNFFKRLAPELYYTDTDQISKPGVDYYPHTFACLLIILIYTLLFFGNITGRFGQSFSDILDKQQFSKDIVWTTIVIIIIIVLDRIIYKLRSVNTDFIFERLNLKKNPSEKNLNNKSLLNHENNPIPNSPRKNFRNNILNYNSDTTKYDSDLSNYALIFKLIMHFVLLIFVHYLIFIKIPLITRIYFFQNYSLVVLYVLCCFYFFITALQIKFGFPLITKGQYFAASTQLSNRVAFKIYRNVPFLYELRAILDWTITRTSLDLFQWFKMEDAYANLYEVKCDMDVRKNRMKGEDRWWFEKFSWGFCFFIFLMFILILPMILFSSFNPNLVENKVLGGKFSINLEIKSPELDSTLFTLNLFQVSTLKLNKLNNTDQYIYVKNTLIPQVDDVDDRKLQKVNIINYSQLDWILSPPTIRELLSNLERKSECFLNIEWEFRREFPQNNKNIVGSRSNQLSLEQINVLRYIIFSLKTHQKPERFKLELKDAFPKIIRLANKQFKYLKFDSKHKTLHKEFTDIQLQLIKENERDIYWKINQLDIKNITDSPFYNKNDELQFLLLNDDVISSFFGFNSDGSMPLSIIGIYATLVYTVGKFVRMFFDKISQRVIYEEMPEPNDLFELCEGIYIYRNKRNLEEENKLYDLLIRIYRSPETLIKITGTGIKENAILKEEIKKE